MSLQAPIWLAGLGYSELRCHELCKSGMMMTDGSLTQDTRVSEGGSSARGVRAGMRHCRLSERGGWPWRNHA
jgi:hypothetical protein